MTSYPMRFTSFEAPTTRCRTLVVEDDRDSSETLALLLRKLGHDVECVESVGAALVKLEEWTPDCVLLDLMLPDASGGLVLRKIRQTAMPIRVAVITAAGPQSLVLKQAEGYQPDAIFGKPLDFSAIRAWLATPS
jgi:CheY-like chemotaxis protein